MANTVDFSQFFKDAYFDTKSAAELYAKSNEYGAKYTKIQLEAAEKAIDLTNTWVKDYLSKLDAFTKPESEPTELVKTMTEVTTSQLQGAPEYVAKFADIAKNAQVAAVELFMAAGADAQSELTAATKKATAKTSKAA
ncbi:MAG: phasin, PhaP [Hyphomicrobiaceae bacterium]|nr:phasin, PhaP [Hyphomicrobiaceae bacterium]